MPYPFPLIEREQFKWTFLRDVTLKVEYEAEESEIDPEGVSNIFQQAFHIPGIGIENII